MNTTYRNIQHSKKVAADRKGGSVDLYVRDTLEVNGVETVGAEKLKCIPLVKYF